MGRGAVTDILRFEPPCAALREAALEYRQEHRNCGEKELHGSALLGEIEDYSEWLALCGRNADAKTVSPDWVQSSTFFAVRERDGRIVGMADIRHVLNRFLRTYGGHVGYGVRPSERRKGYATQILGMAWRLTPHGKLALRA